jgi:molybdopterin-guanine dinucleotide biosynthesis protein A
VSPGEAPPFDAVVLAGGAASRLGGVDKAAAEVGGRRLLDRVLAAVAGAGRIVVVGPERGWEPPGVVVVREDPPGGGPVAALAAGLASVTAPVVAVLAADLPFLTPDSVDTLRLALAAGGDGALLVDDFGVDQLLAGVWRTAALRARCEHATPRDGSVRALVSGLAVRRVGLADAGAANGPPPWWDCDTEADLRRAREWT